MWWDDGFFHRGPRPERPESPPDVGPKYPAWMVTIGVLLFCLLSFALAGWLVCTTYTALFHPKEKRDELPPVRTTERVPDRRRVR